MSLRIMAASVSAADRTWLERTLGGAGYRVRSVADATEAAAEIDADDWVLVIDSGLLEMPHDASWREVRARHPQLGVVIRCLLAGDRRIQQNGDRSFLVHPDSAEGLLEAMHALLPGHHTRRLETPVFEHRARRIG